MDELRDLYQELILDHSKAPRNFGTIEDASQKADGHNPLCGDQLTIYLVTEGDIVKDVKFEGSGCAISVASASLMTDMMKGKTKQEAEKIFNIFHKAVTEDDLPSNEALELLDKSSALLGVKDYPMRVKCATLAWHTLDAALHNQEQATTE